MWCSGESVRCGGGKRRGHSAVSGAECVSLGAYTDGVCCVESWRGSGSVAWCGQCGCAVWSGSAGIEHTNSYGYGIGDTESDVESDCIQLSDADAHSVTHSDPDSHPVADSISLSNTQSDAHCDSNTIGDPEHIAVSPSVPCSGHVDFRGRVGGRVEWGDGKRVWISREHSGRVRHVWSDSCCVEDGERHPKPLSDPRGAGGGGAGLVGVVGLVHCCGRGRDFRSV